MAYWNTSANLLTTWQAWKLLLFAVQLLFVMKITVRFRQLFFLRIDEFIADSAHSKLDTDEVAL